MAFHTEHLFITTALILSVSIRKPFRYHNQYPPHVIEYRTLSPFKFISRTNTMCTLVGPTSKFSFSLMLHTFRSILSLLSIEILSSILHDESKSHLHTHRNTFVVIEKENNLCSIFEICFFLLR